MVGVLPVGTTKHDQRCTQFADSAFKDQEGNVECYDSKSYLKLLCELRKWCAAGKFTVKFKLVRNCIQRTVNF